MLTFVGVGPGDPELITLKAIRAIEKADLIAIADSGKESAVERIAGEYFENKPVLRLSMPMMGKKEDWHASHVDAAKTLIDELHKGKNIAYPVLGDPSLYATSSYLLPLIKPHHPCTVIPGVPAMCAVAAAFQIPLAEDRQPLSVLPGLPKDEKIPDGNIIIMKAGRDIKIIQEKLAHRQAYLAVNLGLPQEQLAPLKEAQLDQSSYFTTILVKPSSN